MGGDLRKIHEHVIHSPARECCGSVLFSYKTSEDPDQLARNQKIIYIVYTVLKQPVKCIVYASKSWTPN